MSRHKHWVHWLSLWSSHLPAADGLHHTQAQQWTRWGLQSGAMYTLVFRHHNHWRIRGLLLWNWSLCWNTESKWFIMVFLAWHAIRPTGAHTVRVGSMWRVWPLLQGLLCHLCQWFLEPEPPPAGGEGRSYQLEISLWLGAHGGTVLFL